MRVIAATYTNGLSGAGIAACRISDALRDAGVATETLVASKVGGSEHVHQSGGRASSLRMGGRQFASKLLLRALGASPGTLSANLFPTGFHRHLNGSAADIVHLHWVGAEMLQIEEISKISTPIVWTLHDEWFALGLEHYESPRDAEALHSPGLRERLLASLDRRARQRKSSHFSPDAICIVCPSAWLARRVSVLTPWPTEKIRVIRNPVPLHIFSPTPRNEARDRLGLDPARKLIGFGAVKSTDDARKGYSHLRTAVEGMAARNDVDLLIFGADSGQVPTSIATHFSGTVHDETKMALLYSAMDVFVCPSTQENLPNTVAEALACGTPCVAFEAGGLPDLIAHRENGYLAQAFSAEDLRVGIEHCLEEGNNGKYSLGARAFAERNLAPAVIAKDYLDVYESTAA
jgi:glycosyltransferase involved in cell wall biosynthesis